MNGIRMPIAKIRTETSGYGTTFHRITTDDGAGGDRRAGGASGHPRDAIRPPDGSAGKCGSGDGVRNPVAGSSASSKLSPPTIGSPRHDATRCRLDAMPLCSSCQR